MSSPITVPGPTRVSVSLSCTDSIPRLLSWRCTERLLPGEHRHVDSTRRALTSDRLDGIVQSLEPKRVGRHQLQREAVRGTLAQREFHGAIRVATGALQR